MAFSQLPEWSNLENELSGVERDVARATVEVVNESGLHLRVAARLAELVAPLGCPITVRSPGGRADASSVLEMMGLAAGRGVRLEFIATGHSAHAALRTLLSRLSPEEFSIVKQPD